MSPAKIQTFLEDFSPLTGEPGQARAKTKFSVEEVEEIRTRAYLEGQQSIEARAAEDQSRTVQAVALQVQEIADRVEKFAFDHKKEAFSCALAIASKVAGEALKQFPQTTIEKIVEESLALLPRSAAMTLSVEPSLCDPLQTLFSTHGNTDAISFVSASDLSGAQCRLDWECSDTDKGNITFDPQTLHQQLETLVEEYLAAEAPSEEQFDLFDNPKTPIPNSEGN